MAATTQKQQKKSLSHWVFLFPALVVFSIYVLYPIFDSLRISFYEWDGLDEKIWVGLGNYQELFEDEVFWISLKNNVLWLIFYLLAPVVGLFLALFLNQKGTWMRVAKSLFFFPFVIPPVVIGLVFSWFMDPHFGLLNIVLNFFNFASVSPLSDENMVTYAIIVAGMWPQIAYCMILYLTGLNSINKDLIEAGQLDGAKGYQMLWHVVLPQLRPATFIAIVVTVIGALRSFDFVAIMTEGGPYNSSSVLAYFMYEQSITNYRMGYGSTIATVLFMIMLVCITYFLYKMLSGEKK